jgi:hypothetical protein
MRFFLIVSFCMFSLSSFSQVPDTARKSKSKRLSLSKFPKPEGPPEKKAFVIVTSDKRSVTAGDTWEDRWTNYIEEQSRIIGQKVLERDGDSLRVTYKVMIDCWVMEDGAVNKLSVSCVPSHSFIVSECTKMVMNAPKNKSTSQPEKYERMHVQQPVDIKVR